MDAHTLGGPFLQVLTSQIIFPNEVIAILEIFFRVYGTVYRFQGAFPEKQFLLIFLSPKGPFLQVPVEKFFLT